MIGVSWSESALVGSLLGQKFVINEFIAYVDLAQMKSDGLLSDKSIIISSYALCGFANFSSIAIQIGGIGSLAPSRQKDLSKLGFKALLAATLATLLTGNIAGLFMT
jgi:CNT family concentrative nucleoside transporter